MLRSTPTRTLGPLTVAVLFAAATGGLVTAACTGGAGEPSDGVGLFEPARSQFERAPNSGEAPPTQASQASGQGSSVGTSSSGTSGSGSLSASCAGTYTCTQPNQPASTAVLTATSNGCTVSGVGYLVKSDGTVTQSGQTIGTWNQTSNGINVNLNNGAGNLTCTRISQGASSSGGTPTPSPTTTAIPAQDAGK
jgi:hypothetical protein